MRFSLWDSSTTGLFWHCGLQRLTVKRKKSLALQWRNARRHALLLRCRYLCVPSTFWKLDRYDLMTSRWTDRSWELGLSNGRVQFDKHFFLTIFILPFLYSKCHPLQFSWHLGLKEIIFFQVCTRLIISLNEISLYLSNSNILNTFFSPLIYISVPDY